MKQDWLIDLPRTYFLASEPLLTQFGTDEVNLKTCGNKRDVSDESLSRKN